MKKYEHGGVWICIDARRDVKYLWIHKYLASITLNEDNPEWFKVSKDYDPTEYANTHKLASLILGVWNED